MVLNGRTEGTVADATRQRVLEAADELGYARSAIAMSLRERRTRTIGIITDEISTSPWAGRMTRAVMQAAAERDHMAVTIDLSLGGRGLVDAMRTLAEQQVEGLVYATMGNALVDLPATAFGLPLVLLDCRERSSEGAEPLAAIVPDDRGGAWRATRRLLDVGHRRVAMLSGDDAQPATIEREAGYRQAMENAGIPPRVIRAGWQMDSGVRGLRELLAGEDPPTGVVCIRDRVAAGAIHAAALEGLQVPRDLSVVGFDDEDFFAESLTPPLTTIALPHEEMGRRAATALLDAMAATGAEQTLNELEIIPCSLVERESVAAPRA